MIDRAHSPHLLQAASRTTQSVWNSGNLHTLTATGFEVWLSIHCSSTTSQTKLRIPNMTPPFWVENFADIDLPDWKESWVRVKTLVYKYIIYIYSYYIILYYIILYIYSYYIILYIYILILYYIILYHIYIIYIKYMIYIIYIITFIFMYYIYYIYYKY